MKILTTVTSVLLGVSILSLSSSLYASDLTTSNISGKQVARAPSGHGHSVAKVKSMKAKKAKVNNKKGHTMG